jgi:vacuolar-type H+-ATPase subunit I/STV1
MWRRRSADRDRTDSVVETKPGRHWSPAQFVALLVGAAAIVFGIVALAKTGIHGDSLRSPHREVWSFDHTPLLAVVEIGFGVLLVLASVSAGASRALMALLGVLAVAFGVVILVDAWPARMHRWFGVHDRNGWLFVITGAVVVLAGLVLPTFSRPETRIVREVHRDDQSDAPDMSGARA